MLKAIGIIVGISGVTASSTCSGDFLALQNAVMLRVIADPLYGLLNNCGLYSTPMDCFTEVSTGEYTFHNAADLSSSCVSCTRDVLTRILSDGTTTGASCLAERATALPAAPLPACWDEVRDLFRTNCADYSYPVKYACASDSGLFANMSFPITELMANCDNMGTCFEPVDTEYSMPAMAGLSTMCATCMQALSFEYLEPLPNNIIFMSNCVFSDGVLNSCTDAANTLLVNSCFGEAPTTTTTVEPTTVGPDETTGGPEDTTAGPEETTESSNGALGLTTALSVLVVVSVGMNTL